MFVKICATTNADDARMAAALGADAVGFVFAPSRRRVTAEQATAIARELPEGVERIGVFAGVDAEVVARCVRQTGLTGAQLHEAANLPRVRALAEEFGGTLKIIQVVAYETDAVDRAEADRRFEGGLLDVLEEEAIWAVLIDASRSGVSGGLGATFDWVHVARLVERATDARGLRPRVILAGGLAAENVAEAIASMKPWGVDVASGVEAWPGKKDAARTRSFLENARRAGL